MLVEEMSRKSLYAWAQGCDTLVKVHTHYFSDMNFQNWIDSLLAELELKQSIQANAHSLFNL